MGPKTYGLMGVDTEERVNFDRLRAQRLARIRRLLDESELGAVLCFDFSNIRYITSTSIGTWGIDKLIRFALLARGDGELGEPIIWDFGSAARHHQLQCPWIADRSRAGLSTFRGAIPPEAGQPEAVARKIRVELETRGLMSEPLGVDVVEPPVLFALQAQGIKVVDAQQLMLKARAIKTEDEITLLTTACMMVDVVYDRISETLRAGVRENDVVALASHTLYGMGSEYVEGVNAISGERCSPHPHNFTDRTLRPGDPAYFDVVHSYNGYRTCYYRTFAVGSATPALLDAYGRCRYDLDHAMSLVKPGTTTAEIAATFAKAQDFGFENEEAAFALQLGHGVGLSVWEKPVISRLVSLDHPEVIEEGMVFALETFWPSTDGWSAARIEEEVVVTKSGCEVITRFPAEELIVTGKRLYTVDGALKTMRERESNLNGKFATEQGQAVREVMANV